MLVKVIVTLVILIAIGALGFTLLGEGVFNSVDRAAAANFAEDARDLDQMIEIYEAFTAGQSAFDNADTAGDGDTIATQAELSAFLQSAAGEQVLDADISDEYTIVQSNGEYVLVTVANVSDETCAEAGEILNSATVAFDTDEATTLAAIVGEGGCFQDTADSNKLAYPLGS